MTGQGSARSEQAAVSFPVGPPPCPSHIARDPEAHAEWQRITPELITAGLLCSVDMAALAMYCMAYARWVKAEEMIAFGSAMTPISGGLVTCAKNGFEQLSQWYIVSGKEQERLHKMLTEFGLSPSARARVRGMAQQGDLFGNDPLAAFQRAAPRAA